MSKRDAKLLEALRRGIAALEEQRAWEDASDLRRLAKRMEREQARRDREAKQRREIRRALAGAPVMVEGSASYLVASVAFSPSITCLA